MEKKLFAIECGNVILAVRPNGDTVIVTEATELVLDNNVMEQIVRNSGAYKSFIATKDEVITKLEVHNTHLQNTIVGLREELKGVKGGDNNDIDKLKRERIKLRNNIIGLKEELEQTKAAKDNLQQELDSMTNAAQSVVESCDTNARGCILYDINGGFLVDCGTSSRTSRVQELLKEGKISLNTVMMIFGDNYENKKKDTNDDYYLDVAITKDED